MATTVSLKFLFQSAGLGKVMKSMQKSFQNVVKEVKRVNKEFKALGQKGKILKDIKNKARAASQQMNKLMGGKKVASFGQNLTSIGNRLGFMAFQWNFMANAAQRALDMVIGGMARVIKEGSLMSDSVVRALAFSTSAAGILNMTDSARKDLVQMRDLIEGLSSGQTIFGPDVVANVAGQFQKAIDNLQATEVILPFALKLKTIDPTIDDEKLATGLVTLFNALDVNVESAKEIEKSMDFITNLADKTTGNFQSSIASFARAAPSAKAVGFAATEVALGLQIGFDVLAANKASGRSGQRAGRIFESFVRELQEIGDVGGKARKFFQANDIQVFSKTAGNSLLPLIDIIGDFRKKLAGLDDQAKAGFLQKAKLTKTAALFVLGAITKTDEELEEMREKFKERGTLEARSILIDQSGQSQILKMQAAIASLKRTIADGFSPALREAALLLGAIVQDREFREFLAEMGHLLAIEIIPHMKSAVKLFKKFFKQIKGEKGTMRFLAKAAVTLAGAIAGLAIIATIGFFALVAAGSFFAMTGQVLTAATAMGIFGGALKFAFRWLLPVFLTMLGFALAGREIAKALEGKEGANPALAAFGLAIGSIGLGGLILSMNKMSGQKGLGGVGVALSKVSGKFGSLFGLGGSAMRSISGFLAGLSRAGLIGLAIAGGIAIGAAIALALDDRVQKAKTFQGGLVDWWNQAGFEFKAAVATTLFEIGKLTDMVIRAIFEGFIVRAQAFAKGFTLAFSRLAKLDFAGALEALGNIDLSQGIDEYLIKTNLARARIKEMIQLMAQFGTLATPGTLQFGGSAPLPFDIPEIQQILKTTGTEDFIGPQEILEIVNQALGVGLFDVETGEVLREGLNEAAELWPAIPNLLVEPGMALGLGLDATAKILKNTEKIFKKVDAEYQQTLEETGALVVSTQALNKSTSGLSAQESLLTDDVITEQKQTQLLTSIEAVTQDRFESFIKTMVASTFSLDALTSSFLVTTLEMSKLKAAATELKRLYDSVTIDNVVLSSCILLNSLISATDIPIPCILSLS